ncbi:MAG TPA: hypothetical protein VM681_04280 [Candidatus Thermoplasmatota archaeon]|nr:hypothetical protein [Candidatus Thermoplasmatota archaeon]
MTQPNRSDTPDWGLFYQGGKRDLTARKSIKVKLPIRQHIKLHALKLFKESNISETVEAALDMYFEKMRVEREASGQAGLPEGLDPEMLANAIAAQMSSADDDE